MEIEIESFEELNLKETLLRGIYNLGYEYPSSVQRKSIKPITSGKDVLTQAQSGTGKTATFSIGILQNIDEKNHYVQAIVLSPTRELATQTYNVIKSLSNFMNVNTHLCIGGTSVKEDTILINKGVQILVGTPGRIYDVLLKKIINTSLIKCFVVDEADEMLSKSFQGQIKCIYQLLTDKTQVILISATMNTEIMEISKMILNNPITILVKNEELTLEGITQYYVNVHDESNKYLTLCDLYNHIMITQSIIFCNKKEKVDQLTNDLIKDKFTVSYIHSNMPQEQRSEIMQQFRNGTTRILITTDLLGRGIDVQQVSLVINYDLPTEKEKYIHRVGRGGRFGRKSVAISFMTRYENKIIKDLENFYKTQIAELPSNIDEIIKNVSFTY